MPRHLDMQDLFAHNLDFFKSHHPHIYQKLKAYQLQNITLDLDDSGELNLFIAENKKQIYPNNPRVALAEQVKLYPMASCWLGNTISHTPDRFLQKSYTSKIISPFQSQVDNFTGDVTKPIGIMYVIGLGLAYHLTALIKQYPINQLVIIEPDLDSIYASLHSIDWPSHYQLAKEYGCQIHLFVNQGPDALILYLSNLVRQHGKYLTCNNFYYQHFSNQLASQFTQAIKQLYQYHLAALGFFEDEQISMANTVFHLNSNTPLLSRAQKTSINLPPAFLLGNGPSLDAQLNFIKAHQDQVMLISCGTTILTLQKYHIVPDFHIEIERTHQTTQLYQERLNRDYTAKVTLICLNSVDVAVCALFKDAYMALKSADTGMLIAKEHLKEDMQILPSCTPTCVNAGLSFSIHFGFKEIYLLGVDLGVLDEAKHHAADSFYFDKGAANWLNQQKIAKEYFPVKGNFRKTVKSSRLFDFSKKSIENLLRIHPDINVFNFNDGALIAGATPLQLAAYQAPREGKTSPNKTSIKDQLLSTYFNVPNLQAAITEAEIKERYLKGTIQMLQTSLASKPITHLDSVKTILEEVHENLYPSVHNQMTEVGFSLIGGTILNFLNCIWLTCLLAKDEKAIQQAYGQGMALFEAFAQHCRQCLQTQPLSTDTYLVQA